jgi:hypothetical protein
VVEISGGGWRRSKGLEKVEGSGGSTARSSGDGRKLWRWSKGLKAAAKSSRDPRLWRNGVEGSGWDGGGRRAPKAGASSEGGSSVDRRLRRARRKKKALEAAASSGEVGFAENAWRRRRKAVGEKVGQRKAVRKMFNRELT